ncbi:Protein MAIN-LIKE 1 [Glycine max]|nr:Protein MAIN-LIKE 1 [Glycine max]
MFDINCYSGLNVQIIVRTRGFGRTLDRVVGKALGREDNRSPKAKAHCIRTAAPVAEDVHHVDDTVDKVFQQPQEEVDTQGFPGRPHDTSVLTGYADHVAIIVWNGEERLELKLYSHGRKVQKFGRPAVEFEGLVAATRLSLMIACSLNTSNQGLISAFADRWHKDTSSFHLPVGKVTITLDDGLFASSVHHTCLP